jgi:hypothetical protein
MRFFERRPGLLLVVATLAVAVAAPVVVGADPSSSPNPAASTAPHPSKAPKAEKTEKTPGIAITLHGTISASKDGQGRPTYNLTSGGTVYDLSAGPPWFWGAKNPLAAFAGKTVTVVGIHAAGSTEVDVESVDGKAIRAEGRPPWAGGPRVVGERHPGWHGWSKAGKHGNGAGRAGAPGQLKDKPDREPEGSEAPEGSERPG